jgi:hypothetical protein
MGARLLAAQYAKCAGLRWRERFSLCAVDPNGYRVYKLRFCHRDFHELDKATATQGPKST